MTRYFRLFIAILVLFGLAMLAKSTLAQAARSGDISNRPTLLSIGRAEPNAKDDCDKNPNSEKCKPPKCKPKKEDCGSVKPPPPDIIIPVTGDYSVGGFCTLTVEFYVDDHRLDAGVITPLPRPLPDDIHKVELGCLLTYYKTEQQIDEMLLAAGKTTICFANSPQKDLQVYFYDYYAADPQWSPLETTVTNGIACAAANKSGVYVATFDTKK